MSRPARENEHWQKCKNCTRKFLVQEWKEKEEREYCTTCFTYIMSIKFFKDEIKFRRQMLLKEKQLKTRKRK